MSKKNFVDNLKHGKAPDVAIAFTRKPGTTRFPDDHKYRVTGWMKMVDPEVMKAERAKLFKPGVGQMLNDILIDSAHKRDGKLMVWCSREDATHVTGTGVGGCTVAIEDIICDGYVNWPQETIDRERESAIRRIGEYVD